MKKWQQEGRVVKCLLKKKYDWFDNSEYLEIYGEIVLSLISPNRYAYWIKDDEGRLYHHSQIDKRTIKILPEHEALIWKLQV